MVRSGQSVQISRDLRQDSRSSYDKIKMTTLPFDLSAEKGSTYDFHKTKLLNDIEQVQKTMNRLIESVL